MIERRYPLTQQKYFLSLMLDRPDLWARCQPIVLPNLFSADLRPLVSLMQEYHKKHNTVPSRNYLQSLGNLELPQATPPTNENEVDIYLEDFQNFARHSAIQNVVVDAHIMIERGEYGLLENKLRDAIGLGIQRDLGVDFVKDAPNVVTRIKDKEGIVPTGWKSIDAKLYGGMARGGLNIFAAYSGMGKSLFLQNIALNLYQLDKNVVYFTLELSEDLTALRMYAMATGETTKEVIKKPHDIHGRVQEIYNNNAGSLNIAYMNVGTSSNDIRAWLTEYTAKLNKPLDAIIVDYLDLMGANDSRISADDVFNKDKAVSEELRGLGHEFNAVIITASQLNRESVGAMEHTHAHIAGGLSKINTSDNVITLYRSEQMKIAGEFLLQFLKTRSSSATGDKLKMKYDAASMRIRDMEESDIQQSTSTTGEIQRSFIDKGILMQNKSKLSAPSSAGPGPSIGSNEGRIDLASLRKL